MLNNITTFLLLSNLALIMSCSSSNMIRISINDEIVERGLYTNWSELWWYTIRVDEDNINKIYLQCNDNNPHCKITSLTIDILEKTLRFSTEKEKDDSIKTNYLSYMGRSENIEESDRSWIKPTGKYHLETQYTKGLVYTQSFSGHYTPARGSGIIRLKKPNKKGVSYFEIWDSEEKKKIVKIKKITLRYQYYHLFAWLKDQRILILATKDDDFLVLIHY